MQTAFVVLTGVCNNRCDFCFNRQSPDYERHGSLRVDAFADALVGLRALGFGHLVFTGGEPLLHPSLGRILSATRDAGFTADMITNGRALDASRARELAATLPGVLIWSLNDLYNAVPEPYRFLADTEKRLGDYRERFGERLSTIFVFTRDTYRLIPDVFRLCRAAGVGLILQPAYMPDAAGDDGISLDGEQWAEALTLMAPWAAHNGAERYVSYLEGLYAGGAARPRVCQVASHSCVVDTDLSLYACFHRPDLVAGRLGEDPIDEIRDRLNAAYREIGSAGCFGAHCASLFVY